MLASPALAPAPAPHLAAHAQAALARWTARLSRAEIPVLAQTAEALEIGRASCRERVYSSV